MTLRTIATELLEDKAGDLTAAEEHVDTTLSDKKLQQRIQAFLHTALVAELYDVWLSKRDLYRRPLAKGETSPSRLMTTALSSPALLDWPLGAGGKLLGDCTKAEINVWCVQKSKRIDTELFDLSWVRLVGDALKASTRTVRAQLKEAEVRRLHERAVRASEKAAAA